VAAGPPRCKGADALSPWPAPRSRLTRSEISRDFTPHCSAGGSRDRNHGNFAFPTEGDTRHGRGMKRRFVARRGVVAPPCSRQVPDTPPDPLRRPPPRHTLPALPSQAESSECPPDVKMTKKYLNELVGPGGVRWKVGRGFHRTDVFPLPFHTIWTAP
jgi:hypothetical protein